MNIPHHNITWLCRVRLTLLLAHRQTHHVLNGRLDSQETLLIWRIRTRRNNSTSTSHYNSQHAVKN
jgi:hypothetical protein